MDIMEIDMSHTPHELAEEFPEQQKRIAELRKADAHFARLADAYHEINRQIHRAETRVEPVSESAEEDMRKQRLKLKDEIGALIRG